ncbi:MAG: hypothetical protein R3E90_07665 [Marinicella sp.]
MFSIFKKKPKLNNQANQDLSIMLLDEPNNPVLNHEFFENKKMDFSLESLEILDEYLESLRANLPENEELVKITLRAGSYIGEVIRKNSETEYNWLDFKEATKVDSSLKRFGFSLGVAAILWSKPNSFVFPLAKVLKRLENGPEDSVHSLARVAIEGFSTQDK